ncbi:glycosyltransferase [Pseudomonas nitroreducens]|uniref:glycosyltransferase n=1 Tax=Pseudomonas nitroreducens TaxID=46680 RepID=UPI002FDF2D7D
MTTLFIGKRFYTNKDAVGDRFGRIYRLPWHWSQSGLDVELWLIDYHTRHSVSEREGHLRVISTPVFGVKTLVQLIRSLARPPRNIVASGDCYIGLLGYFIARLTGASFTFDIYDKYTTFGGYRKLPAFDPFSFLVRHADHLLFASQALASDTLTRSNRGGTATVIPNGIDEEDFYPRSRSDCRKAMGLQEDVYYVGYFGSMDLERGITDLLQAMSLIRRSGIDARLLLAGRNVDDTDLSAPWVDYLGTLAHADIATALGCCDVLTLPYRRSEYLDMASSCKIAEYLAVQVPIAATRTPNLCTNFPIQARELDKVLAAPNDPESLATCIAHQLLTPIMIPLLVDMTWKSIAAQAIAAIDPLAQADQ